MEIQRKKVVKAKSKKAVTTKNVDKSKININPKEIAKTIYQEIQNILSTNDEQN